MPPVALFLCGQRSTLTAKVTRGYDKRVEWKPVQTFQATALVDEAYRLIDRLPQARGTMLQKAVGWLVGLEEPLDPLSQRAVVGAGLI